MKKFLINFTVVLLLLIGTLYVAGYGYILKAVAMVYGTGHTTTFLDDYTYFDNRTITKSSQPQPWTLSADYNKIPETPELQNAHRKYGSVAFLIIKGDSIWHEQYFEGYNSESKSNSFSMAKSYVSALLGKAIADGYIKSLDQKVSDFFSEYKSGLAAQLTVGDLSSMASGLDWDEAYYNPFSITTRAYFDKHFREKMLKLKIVEQPGKAYKYLSGNTFLLGMVLEKATKKTLTQYLTESLWQPMGCESDALWQLDSKESGLEKAYCCIASNARDFARLGKLYRDYGKWNGEQLLDSTFVATSVQPRFPESPEYGYGWWLLDYKGTHYFMMRGHLGQYVIVNPKDKVIIVRLGHHTAGKAPEGSEFSSDIYEYIDEAEKMLGHTSK
ncbi:hypothetical protein RCZ04_02760 [Capnocytophaga sp. HP1101]